MKDIGIDLLTINDYENSELGLDVIKEYGVITAITDLAILTGAYIEQSGVYNILNDKSLKGRSGSIWTKSQITDGRIHITYQNSISKYFDDLYKRDNTIRPVLYNWRPYVDLSAKRNINNSIDTIEFGEYPQYVANVELQKRLTKEFLDNKFNKTGKTYTLYCVYSHSCRSRVGVIGCRV